PRSPLMRHTRIFLRDSVSVVSLKISARDLRFAAGVRKRRFWMSCRSMRTYPAVQLLYNGSPEHPKTPQNALVRSLSHNNIRKTGAIRNRQVIGASPIVGS